MARMADPTDGLIRAIDQEASTAYGSDQAGELSTTRARAIRQYWGENLMPAPEGRSQVRDRSVFETINWILPSLIDIFAPGDDEVVKVKPVGPDDVQGAIQEGQYLNHVMLQKNPWLNVCLTLFVDAMLTKNAYVYVYRDYKREVDIDRYERQTKESLQILLKNSGVEIIEQKAYPDPDGAMEPVMGPDGQPLPEIVGVDPAGQPITQPAMQPVMLFDVTLRTTTTSGEVCIDVLPPEKCKVSERTPTYRIDEDCSYFEYECEDTISSLRQKGIDVPEDINDEDSVRTEEDNARDVLSENYDNYSADPAMRRVKVRTIWIRYDFDGDGISELQRVIRIGRQIFSREEVSRIPIASTVPMPVPHRHIGMSVADIVGDLQDIKTAILRGGLDNLYLSNNIRMAVSNKVNIDDVLLSRPGQPIRVDTDGADAVNHILPLQVPFVFPQAMEGLEYMDQTKENRTGVNRYFTGVDQNAMNKTASGQNQLITMAQQRVKLLARILGGCVEDIASLTHECILKSGHKKATIQLRNDWITVDPSTWKKRTDFKLCVAYAAGNKDSLVQKLILLGQQQGAAISGGLPIVTPNNIYNTGMELAKAMDFPDGNTFWTEPAKVPPPPPPQPDPSVIAIETLRAQSNERIKATELRQQTMQSEEDNAFNKYKTDADNETKIKVAELTHEHNERMKHIDGDVAAGLEGVKAHVNPKTKEADAKKADVKQKDGAIETLMKRLEDSDKERSATMAEVLKAISTMNGPKKIIRGKDGRATGVEPA